VDRQQKKLYSAENKVFKNESQLTETQLKKFFYLVTGDPWFVEKYGRGFSLYTVGEGMFDHSFAVYKEIYILNPVHFTEASLLHEISHAVKRVRKEPHGTAFQKRYIELVKKYISNEKGEELEKLLKLP